MKLKRASLIFLLTLFIILVFIIGVRYGQRVEKTNKIIDFFISLPPTSTPQPTQKPLEFKTYKNKACGVQFLYPASLSILQESSTGARLADKFNSLLVIDCDEQSIMEKVLTDENIASQEITLKNKKMVSKVESVGETDVLSFKSKNERNLKTIYISITKSLYPLFEKSLEFLP